VKPSVAIFAVFAALALCTRHADAQIVGGSNVSRGPGANVQVGAAFCIDCMENEESVGLSVDPGVGFSAGLLWRMIPYLSVHMDFFYEHHDATEAGIPLELHHFGVLIEPRVWLPIRSIDIYAGLGVGWNEEKPEIDEYATPIKRRGFILGVSFGVEYRIVDLVSVGAALRYLVPFYNELSYDGAEFESHHSTGTHSLMFGVAVTAYFTRAEVWSRRSRPPSRACAPGTHVPCPCPDGTPGIQTCHPDGSEWGPCQCDRPTSVRVCEPGATQECLCGAGVEGVQTCEDSGTRWGSCACGPPWTPEPAQAPESPMAPGPSPPRLSVPDRTTT
jgi:hypothetical protein